MIAPRLKSSLLGTAAVFLTFQLLLPAAMAERKPNVVFIVADDLGWGELGCYGQEKIRTPNIDRLAAEGMRFTQHYSGAPVCAPSRNVLMTGLHLGHAEIRGNKQDPSAEEGQWPISDSALTIAEVLKQAGYATGAVGKWGLGPVGSTGDPNRQGFDFFFGYNCQAVAHSYYPRHLWRNTSKIIINETPVPGHARKPEGKITMEAWMGGTYAPDLIMAEALQFIESRKNTPFFLFCAFTEPHVALQPPKTLVESYPEEWDAKPYRGEAGYTPHPRPRAAYAALISSLDDHVGKLMDALARNGLADNTLVVFTSDNGTTHRRRDSERFVGGTDPEFFNSTRGLRGYKGSVYEGGLRVPCIFRWPGKIKPGTVTDYPSFFPDHFATICDFLDVRPPGKRDGISLLPVLLNSGRPRRNPMLWVFAEYGGQVAVRLGDYKIVRQQLNTEQPGPWEVYDISKDIGETTNLASKNPDLIKKARKILDAQTSPNPVFPVKLAP